jgi:hypothetical protein
LLGFKKGEQDNLSPTQLKTLREYIKQHLKWKTNYLTIC